MRDQQEDALTIRSNKVASLYSCLTPLARQETIVIIGLPFRDAVSDTELFTSH
jgi:hypothetical protein